MYNVVHAHYDNPAPIEDPCSFAIDFDGSDSASLSEFEKYLLRPSMAVLTCISTTS